MKVTPSRLAASLALITAGFFPQAYGSAVSDSYQQYQLASSQGNDQQALSYAKAAVEEEQCVTKYDIEIHNLMIPTIFDEISRNMEQMEIYLVAG